MHIRVRSTSALRAVAAALGVALVSVALSATPANAKPGGGSAAGSTEAGKNCVVALAKGTNTNLTRTCFSTFTEAISFATNGAVTDAPALASDAAGDSSLAAKLNAANSTAAAAATSATAAASLLLGIDYFGVGYTGPSITWTGPVPCAFTTADVDYQINLPQAWWDRISSFRALFSPALCLENHFDSVGCAGPGTGYLAWSWSLPPSTRCIRWS